MPGFLVFFVTDDVDDDLADAIREVVRLLAGSRTWAHHAPGFFDDPEPAAGSARTTGGYLRVDAERADGDDARAVCAAVQALSERSGVEVELQWREAVLGRVRAGVPDDGLEEALAAVTGEA